MSYKGCWMILLTLVNVLFWLPPYSSAGQWINPKEVIGDPWIARLQQGRTELTPQEKADLNRYGYTGLELMTYVDDNREPGQDFEHFLRNTRVTETGHIKIREWLRRQKFFYKDLRALLTYDGIKPGEVENLRITPALYPQDIKGDGVVVKVYLESALAPKEDDIWWWSNTFRRIKRMQTHKRDDSIEGADFTLDDFYTREPWEEDHHILGEDVYKGKECLVVESKHRLNPNYYLSKRVSWVERDNFIDFHQEQFDGEGYLWKVIDIEWKQIKPWNYWVPMNWSIINIQAKTRALLQLYDWIFDQGFDDGEFSLRNLEKIKPWRVSQKAPPSIKNLSDFPPEPQIRWEFWEKLGHKPRLKGQ